LAYAMVRGSQSGDGSAVRATPAGSSSINLACETPRASDRASAPMAECSVR
jgi:hypothetical protein